MASITYMYATGDGQARIDIVGFQILIWLSAGLPLPFLVGRLYVRIRVFRKWFIDDYLVILAWLLVLAFSISWQNYCVDMYVVVNALSEAATETIAGILRHATRFQTALVISYLLQAFGLWSIKSAFLAFFWKLGTNVKHQRPIWWTVAVWNAICFAIWVGTATWKCVAVPVEVAIVQCNNSAMAAFSQASIRVETAMDVLSDIAILIIPATLLWKSQIQFRKKLALGGIFSLTLFVMIASIVRTVVTTNSSQNDDLTWMSAWAGIEMGVAIIVACLCSFRALFTNQSRSHGPPGYKAYELEYGKRRGPSRQGYPDGSGVSSPRKARLRHTLYPLDSLFTQAESYADVKATTELGDRYREDMRQLSGLDKSYMGKVLVRNSITVSNEPAVGYDAPIPVHTEPEFMVDIETLSGEKSWLKA